MINYDLKKIKLVIFDVDGVLSRETISLSLSGEPLRTVNIKDGYAIQIAEKMGLHIVVMTGGKDDAVKLRYEKLGVKDILMGCAIKIEAYKEIKKKYCIDDENIAYMGDDIPDHEVMSVVGCACCPADACPDIKEVSLYISNKKGGCGCARDILEQILRSQGKWLADERAFGW